MLEEPRMSPVQYPAELQLKFRSQLANRRARLERTIADLNQPPDLLLLLNDVDAALSRLDGGSYGECAVCHTEIAADDLLANPTASYCLCELSPERQSALQRDLDLAWRVQAALLPPPDVALPGWQAHYRYIPNGPVSGDYCDVIVTDANPAAEFYFMLGDVSGKGVAASLLMAHLNASLRAFARTGLPPQEALAEANRLLAASTLSSHYATLACGRASASGEVEIANAGHCPPFVVRTNGRVEALEEAGLPLGLALTTPSGARYAAEKVRLDDGDSIVLYTDGVTEAANVHDTEYGAERLGSVLARCGGRSPRELVTRCLADVSSFLDGGALSDDLTILALGRCLQEAA
jgi:sigma-B regulation protein RsbU (phosphoserine phosphatase)